MTYVLEPNTANEVTLEPDEIISLDAVHTHTGKGDIRTRFVSTKDIASSVQRKGRLNVLEDGNVVWCGYAIQLTDPQRDAVTLSGEGIAKRLEETRPDYDSLGGSLTYSNIGLAEALRDYWPRTPFGNVTVYDQDTEIIAQDVEVHEANTTQEFEDLFTPADTDAYLGVSDTFRPAQTSWTTESDLLTRNGTALQQNTDYSNDEAESIDGSGVSLSLDFTVEHTIPADSVEVWGRMTTAAPGTTGTGPELTFSLNGDTWTPVSSGAGFQNLDWRDFANNTFGGTETYSGGDITPGDYTLTIEGTSAGDGQVFDVVAPLDGRFSYTFDNDTSNSGERVSGPELYPEITAESSIFATSYNIIHSDVSSSIDDITGVQAISVSNDGGSTYNTFNNTTSVSHDYSNTGREARLRVTLGRYGSRTDATPTTGFNPQTISSITHTIDGNDLTVIDELELSRNHFDNLKTLHEYGTYVWSIEHTADSLANMPVESFVKGSQTKPKPDGFDLQENKSKEVSAQQYYNTIYLEGALVDGSRPTAEVKDNTLIDEDGREIGPGVLRDSNITTEAGADFRATALLSKATSKRSVKGTVTAAPEFAQAGYAYPALFEPTGWGSNWGTNWGSITVYYPAEEVRINISQDGLSATYDFVSRNDISKDIRELKRNANELGDQV